MENKKDNNIKDKEHSAIKPDPETLGKTDPQDVMHGPLSSLARRGSKIMDTNKSKEEADKKHKENL